MNKKILIFSGDPNSINSEIILKCWKNIDSTTKKRIYIITNYELIKSQLKRLGYSSKIEIVKNINDLPTNKNLKILNIGLTFKDSFNVTVKECKKFIRKSLNLAHKLSLDPLVSGLINCPINKNLLGNKKGGLTEFFAKKCRSKKNSEVMLISNEKISVCPITTHIDLQDVSKRINGKVIIEKIKTIDAWYKKIKKKKSKICLLGLNPHNSEFRKNSIEQKIIIPTIKKLKNKGINIKGPFSADTIFINEYKKYDVVVGMYHDQVLSPFKALFKFDAINITLGLKYLRVSPDHGVAHDLINKRKANPTSLLKCIKFISKF
ncbi:4-hydroxythreonine-4-phosphate dehydrogenase PdxA [Candidatus Pelagibacter bacterium]|jgi:4-hydroxy-L-threonine phosphate dehydrogenase PdxA|nr:4-hydroxythreonine-4-phosphate dehydrogenase PdxA [Candidatus Pelagibacter bacterium]